MKFASVVGCLSMFCCAMTCAFSTYGQNESLSPKEKTPLELLTEGNKRYQRGDILGSIKHYNDVIDKQPYSAIAYQKRARSKRRMQNYQGAIKDYEKAIQLKHDMVVAYLGKAQTFLSIKNYKSAIKDYDRALDLTPQKKYLPKIYYNRGLAHLELKNYKEALSDFNKTIDLQPKMDKAYLNRGNIYYHFNKGKQACADWIQAKELGNEKAAVNLDRICK